MKAHRLKPWQEDAMDYAIDRRRIALFMEMRLGKTPVSIRWAKIRKAKRVLLVAPLSTLLGQLNWQGELRREGIDPILLPHVPRSDWWSVIRPSVIERTHDTSWNGRYQLARRWTKGWVGVNYEALRTQPEILHGPWDAIILDESTRIRNPRAQTTKVLIHHTDHIPNRAILTGLPNPESPLDFFSQFQFLNGDFMGYENYWAFRQKKFYTNFTNWDWTPLPKVREEIRKYVHSHAFVLSRKQAGVGSSKVREQRSVQLNTQQKELLREMKREFSVDGTETKWVPVVHTWMQRVAGGFHPTTLALISDRKIRLLEELVMDEFRKQPLVVWFRFNREMEVAYKYLAKRNRKLNIGYVHGGVKDSKHVRIKLQNEFHKGGLQVLFLQASLGKFGWNLSRSSTAVYYSNTYEFEARSQSEDRLIHIEKKDPCLYLDLVTLGTPDEDVVEALSRKRMTARLFSMHIKQQLIRRLQKAA
jgi:SNF2 family DNA or RNA helicase